MLLSIHNLLLLAIVTGQLIKLPISAGSGASLLDLVVCLLVGYFFIKRGFKLPKPPIWVISATIFILVAGISNILSPLSLTSTERLTGFFYTVRFSAFVLLAWLIPKEGISQTLTKAGVILAVLGLLQFIFIPDMSFLAPLGWDPHYFRAVSTFLDPNFLGAFLVLTLLLIKNNRLLFILVYLALLTTFSRGAYLTFLTGFLAFSFIKKSVKLALVTVLLFSLLMISFFTYHSSVAAPRGIDRAQSAEARLDTWQQGIKMFLEYPVLGVGFNLYRNGLKELKLADEGFLSGHGASTNDSSLLFVAATTGLIGLGAYLFFLGTLFGVAIKKNPILLAGLLALIAQSPFANTLFYPPLLLWLLLEAQEI